VANRGRLQRASLFDNPLGISNRYIPFMRQRRYENSGILVDRPLITKIKGDGDSAYGRRRVVLPP
jgi:hypothetical protein